ARTRRSSRNHSLPRAAARPFDLESSDRDRSGRAHDGVFSLRVNSMNGALVIRSVIAIWRSGFSRRRCKYVRRMYVLRWDEAEAASDGYNRDSTSSEDAIT